MIEPKFLDYIKNDKTFLEREPLETACRRKELNAFIHNGFWQCMDTKRDKDFLEKILREKKSLNKKILIVGGTGFIGYHLGKKCLRRKWRVVSISTTKPPSSRFLKGVKYILADISDKDELRKNKR